MSKRQTAARPQPLDAESERRELERQLAEGERRFYQLPPELSADEAAQTNAALAALEAAMAGEQALDGFFADLIEREPQLPAHLRRDP